MPSRCPPTHLHPAPAPSSLGLGGTHTYSRAGLACFPGPSCVALFLAVAAQCSLGRHTALSLRQLMASTFWLL